MDDANTKVETGTVPVPVDLIGDLYHWFDAKWSERNPAVRRVELDTELQMREKIWAVTRHLYTGDPLSATPQPAASDVPHDEPADCGFDGPVHDDGMCPICNPETVQPLATPAPSTSTEAPSLDAWAYAFAVWRQGQRSTPRCEEPGAADIRICRDLIEGMLACRPSAPPTSTEEALRAENERLREALEFYADPENWIDTPAWDGDPEVFTPKAIPVRREDGTFHCDCGDTALPALSR